MNDIKGALFPILAVLLVVGAWVVKPDEKAATRTSGTVAISQTAYACPAGSIITVATGQVAAGSSRTATVLPGKTADPAFGNPAAWQKGVVQGQGVIVEQHGRSSGAVGYFAGTAPQAGGGGLVVGECPGIVDDAWYVGAGSGGKHFTTLIVTNLGQSAAAIDISLWGPKGEIEGFNNTGIVIKPQSVRRIKLDELAAGESELAVKVHRRQGAVSVVANDTSTSTSQGTEPLSATQAPSRDQVVGGLVEGATGRTLLLLNPGRTTAQVKAAVIGAKGTVTPTGLDNIQVQAGALKAVTLPTSAGADEQALRITSDQPVSATVRMAPSTKDYAYAEATPVLSGPTVVPVDVGSGLAMPRLILTAPGKQATVEVQGFDADMKPLGTATVSIDASTTKGYTSPIKRASYLVLRPTGDVIGAATYGKGDAIASLALTGAPIVTRAPQVRPAPQR